MRQGVFIIVSTIKIKCSLAKISFFCSSRAISAAFAGSYCAILFFMDKYTQFAERKKNILASESFQQSMTWQCLITARSRQTNNVLSEEKCVMWCIFTCLEPIYLSLMDGPWFFECWLWNMKLSENISVIMCDIVCSPKNSVLNQIQPDNIYKIWMWLNLCKEGEVYPVEGFNSSSIMILRKLVVMLLIIWFLF